MYLSVVTPVYQASQHLNAFHNRMSIAAQSITEDYEIIYINDGSTDDSLAKLLAIHHQDARAVVIDLTRNFGQNSAIRTGLAHAKGELVFVIDDDLEEKPEWLQEFHRTLVATDSEAVFSIQRKRGKSRFNRIAGAAFFFFMRKILRAESVANVMTARLMTQSHVKALCKYTERNASLTILSKTAGCRHVLLSFDKETRPDSSYTLYRKLCFMIDHIVCASSRPLLLPLILAGAWMAGCFIFCAREMFLMVTGIGSILLSVAIIGAYLSRALDDIRGRPLVVIRQVYARDDELPSQLRS